MTKLSLILLIDQRVCKCGATYNIPNTRILRRDANGNMRPLDITYGKDMLQNWPREKVTILSYSEACQSCFDIGEPYGQHELFPNLHVTDKTQEIGMEQYRRANLTPNDKFMEDLEMELGE